MARGWRHLLLARFWLSGVYFSSKASNLGTRRERHIVALCRANGAMQHSISMQRSVPAAVPVGSGMRASVPARSVPLPAGFVVGLALVIGVVSGGSSAALLMPGPDEGGFDPLEDRRS